MGRAFAACCDKDKLKLSLAIKEIGDGYVKTLSFNNRHCERSLAASIVIARHEVPKQSSVPGRVYGRLDTPAAMVRYGGYAAYSPTMVRYGGYAAVSGRFDTPPLRAALNDQLVVE